MTRTSHFSPAAWSILAALVVLSFLPASTARADEPQVTLTTNPVALVGGFVNVELEVAVAPVASVYGGLNVMVWNGVWADRNDDVFAIGPEVGLRLFPFLGAPGGLWLGPYFGLPHVRAREQGSQSRGAGVQAGGMVGYTFLIADVLTLSGGAGLGWADLSRRIDGSQTGFRGVHPRFRFAVGFAF